MPAPMDVSDAASFITGDGIEVDDRARRGNVSRSSSTVVGSAVSSVRSWLNRPAVENHDVCNASGTAAAARAAAT